MIFVRVRVDHYLDRLVGRLRNFQRNTLSEACRRIKNDDSFIVYQECGLPPVVRHDVNAAANVFDRIAELRIDLPKLRLHCRQNRNIFFQGLLGRLPRDLPSPDGSEHQCKYELFHFSSPCDPTSFKYTNGFTGLGTRRLSPKSLTTRWTALFLFL